MALSCPLVNSMHVGDWGDDIQFTFYECIDGVLTIMDISAATLQEAIFKKPDTIATVTQVTTFVTDGTDGKTRYVTVAGDIDEEGSWQAQGHVILPTGEWKSDIVCFDVKGNL